PGVGEVDVATAHGDRVECGVIGGGMFVDPSRGITTGTKKLEAVVVGVERVEGGVVRDAGASVAEAADGKDAVLEERGGMEIGWREEEFGVGVDFDLTCGFGDGILAGVGAEDDEVVVDAEVGVI